MILSSLHFAIMGVSVKLLSITSISLFEIIFYRGFISTLIIFASFYKNPPKNNGGKLFFLILRGFTGSVAINIYFYNIATMTLANSTTFSNTAPIFTLIFSSFIIKEYLSKKYWLLVFVSFIGIILISKPNITSMTIYDYFGILNGVFAAFSYIIIRYIKDNYDTRIIVLSFTIQGTLSAIFLLLITKQSFSIPDFYQIFLIIIMGITATLGQIYMTKSYKFEKAGIASAVSYSNVIFSAILGLFFFKEFPDLSSFAGIILILFSGVILGLNKENKMSD